MADKNITLKDENNNNLYPTTQVGNVLGMNDYINTFATKTLANVTYPTYSADGTAHTGAGDRVVEMKVSTDGLTWYRKWASNWKECGGYIHTNSDSFTTKTFPITFSNAHPTVVTNFDFNGTGTAYYSYLVAKEITNSSFQIKCYNTSGYKGTTWYACGY